jgi:predicted glycoside hydrolase/deacetylase ChbG (UPF0249 family)
MTNIVLCADDFGIAPGVDDAILELVAMDRLSAVSCLVDFEQFRHDGPRLARYRDCTDIGLHIALTGARPLWQVMAEGYLGRLSRDAMHAEIGRQIAIFREVMGFDPGYLDGHQHVHNLKGVREAVAEWAQAIGACVRVTDGPLSLEMLRRPAPLTAAFLAWMGRGLARACAQRRVPTNRQFRGVRSFREQGSYRKIFLRAATDVRDATIIMCHPGWPDDVLAERDPVVQPRMMEMRYLRSPEFLSDLAELGLTLTRFRALKPIPAA